MQLTDLIFPLVYYFIYLFLTRCNALKDKKTTTGPLSGIKENVSAVKTICSTDQNRLGSFCQGQGATSRGQTEEE